MIGKEELTDEKMEAIDELRRRIINDLTPKLLEDESLFYRFLKARDFNVEKAEAMLRKHITWREEFKVDTVLGDFIDHKIVKYVPSTIICFDKEGCPVTYLDFGAADHKGILNATKKIECVRYVIKTWEMNMQLLKEQSAKFGRLLHNACYIVNCDHLTFAKVTNKQSIELLLYVTVMQENNYPETMKTIYIINASVYFTVLWSILKFVVAPALQEKIKVFGSDCWKESLLEAIDADQLPAFLGGNRTDPDGNPLCKSFVGFAEIVPKCYYLKRSKKNLITMPGVKRLKIFPLSKMRMEFDVVEENSFLEWEFETKANDIGFGVYFKEASHKESEEIELIPKQRFDTYFGSETGIYQCTQSGKYIILFDNSYSWLRPKEIYYRVKVISPKVVENGNEV